MLADVTARVARARPIATAHTIFEIVLHLTAWAREARRRLDGAPAASPAEGDWPPVVASGEADWTRAIGHLEEAHEELRQAIAGFSDERLDEPVPTTADSPAADTICSYYVLLHGVSQHMAYHAGQIALLTKATASSGAS